MVVPPEPEANEETTEVVEEVAGPPVIAKLAPEDSLTADEFAERRAAKIREAMGEEPEEEPAAEEADAGAAPDGEPATAEEAADRAEAELPADATDEEIAAARAEAEENFVGYYKTREDAETGIAEKDETIQRLYAERDRLKKALEEREREQPAAETLQIDRPAWSQWAAERIEEIDRPDQAEALAVAALTDGGYDGYEVFLEAWLASEDPAVRARATTFNNEVMMEMARVRAAAVAETSGPGEEELTRQRRADAIEAREKMLAKHSDFSAIEQDFAEVVQGLDEETRDFLSGLAQGDVDSKARAMDYLYHHAKATSLDRRTRARSEARRQEQASEDADKLAATVTTTEGTPARTTLSESEQKVRDVVNARRREWNLPLLED